MAWPGWNGRLRRCGPMCPPSAAPSTSTATYWPTPPTRCMRRVSADYNDMIYAESAKQVEQRRRAFLRKWRLRCPAVATSLEEAGDRLFVFLPLPSSKWKSARTTNAIEPDDPRLDWVAKHRW